MAFEVLLVDDHQIVRYATKAILERQQDFRVAGEVGNGDEASGDGWRNRGRGPFQITGADNYKWLHRETGLEVLEHPDILLTPTPGIISACWFWKTHNLDAVDDDKDMRLETRRINGGEIGLQDRQNLFNHILMYLESI